MNKILGIDPGIERLGWAFLGDENKKFTYLSSGVKKTLKTQPQMERLLEIHDFLDDLIKTEKPDILSLERLFFSKNAKTAMVVGPNEIKLSLAGYGKADKASILNMLKMTLDLPDKKFIDDESDAIAIACCGVIHSASLQMYSNRLFSKKDYQDLKGRN